MKIIYQLQGVQHALKKLKLTQGQLGKEVEKAMRVEVKPLVATMRQLAPVEFGGLRISIGQKVKSYAGGRVVVAIVGPRRGASFRRGRRKVNPSRYAHLKEFGFRHRSGKYIPARPYIRPTAFQHRVRFPQRVQAQLLRQLKVP